MSRQKRTPETYYWRVWKQGIGIIRSDTFEANSWRAAKQLASEASGRYWISDWQSEGCTIAGARTIRWKSDIDHDNREIMLFVYNKEK